MPPASRSCPPTPTTRPRRSPGSRSWPPRRTCDVLGWRDLPTDPDLLGATARSVMPTFKQLFVAAKAGRVLGLALERMAFWLRKRAEKETETYFPSLSGRTITYKGMLTTDQLDKFFPELTDPDFASRDRRRALAVLHQHVPVLAAGPPVPVHRPQRRDQHRAGQPQLDACPRGAARQRPDPRRPRAALPDLYAGRLGLGVVRRGPGAPAPGRPLAAARDADDDPGGVGERHHDGSEAARVLRVPLDADGAVGRPGLGGLLRRHQGRRGPGPQRSAPSRYWVTEDGLVVLASEAGVLDIDPADRDRRRAGSSPAGSSWSTSTRTGSSPTPR